MDLRLQDLVDYGEYFKSKSCEIYVLMQIALIINHQFSFYKCLNLLIVLKTKLNLAG
jgi:hypothetical protein